METEETLIIIFIKYLFQFKFHFDIFNKQTFKSIVK